MTRNLTAVSLFSSAGLGELGLVAEGFNVIVANEVVENRCDLYEANHPRTKMVRGDVWHLQDRIVGEARRALGNQELTLVYATPPCQGMSTNGVGKLKAEVKAGNRDPEDLRNRLVIPALNIIEQLQPRWVLFENVPNMVNTTIRTENGMENIIGYVGRRLGPSYVGRPEVINCSDYGVPQTRKRLIILFTRSAVGAAFFRSRGGTFFPAAERGQRPTLRDVIGALPPLDGKPGSESNRLFHPLHYVQPLSPEKYWWVEKTPEGETAFNNQCANPECGYQANPRHEDQKIGGRWKSNRTTPIYCVRCKSLLPRPSLIDATTGQRRLLKGFHSAYRRMRWDEPARAITTNVFWEASDNKIHPQQNRTLSVLEALIISTVADYPYKWVVGGKDVPRNHIAETLGESVPPRLIQVIASRIRRLEGPKGMAQIGQVQQTLGSVEGGGKTDLQSIATPTA